MEIRGRQINLKYIIMYFCFNALIILDMFLITVALVFELPTNVISYIQYFDLFVCLILLWGLAIINLS